MNCWSYESSSIDWCEDNYQVATYIAEFLNTISNIPIVFLSYYGFLNYPNSLSLWMLMAAIGVSSAYFHATLSELGQILDEEAILLFAIWLELNMGFKVSLILLSVAVLTIWPSINRFYLAVIVCYQLSRYYWNPKHHHLELKNLYYTSLVVFAVAGICWIVDMVLCHHLLISLHWVWHLLTAFGLYYCIVYLEADRLIHVAQSDHNHSQIKWRYLIIPTITIKADHEKYIV